MVLVKILRLFFFYTSYHQINNGRSLNFRGYFCIIFFPPAVPKNKNKSPKSRSYIIVQATRARGNAENKSAIKQSVFLSVVLLGFFMSDFGKPLWRQ